MSENAQCPATCLDFGQVSSVTHVYIQGLLEGLCNIWIVCVTKLT